MLLWLSLCGYFKTLNLQRRLVLYSFGVFLESNDFKVRPREEDGEEEPTFLDESKHSSETGFSAIVFFPFGVL